MKNTEVKVMALIFHHPNNHYSDLYFWRGNLTQGQWYYWVKKLEAKGWITSIFHGHNRFGWTGYKVTELGKQTYLDYSLADIPF